MLQVTSILSSPKNENLYGGRPFLWFERRNPFGTFLANIRGKPVLEVIDHKNRVIYQATQERRIGNDKKIFIRFP